MAVQSPTFPYKQPVDDKKEADPSVFFDGMLTPPGAGRIHRAARTIPLSRFFMLFDNFFHREQAALQEHCGNDNG